MTAKVLDQQNEWNSRVENSRDAYQKVVVEVPVAEKQVAQLRDDLTLQRLDWGRHWDAVDTVVNDQSRGMLNISIGRNDNLVRVTDAGDAFPTLYAFQPAGDGMVYVGAFRVTQVDVNQSAIQLDRPPRPGEAQTWKPGKWRFRDGFPAAKEGEIGGLINSLTFLEESVKGRQLNLSIQQKSVVKAEALLKQRLKELNGNPDLPAEAEEVYRKGLVESLRNAQDKRDEAIAEVQKLREQLNAVYEKFEGLLAENGQLETKLRPATQTGQSSDGLNGNVKN
ncbi:MAG: hypothetical protein JKY95_16080 [Planctomycetaceae bacterium]|nr:hypothetical protein [Planctomycetaceae bacterium]